MWYCRTPFSFTDLKIRSYRDHLNSIVSRLASLALTATWVKTKEKKTKSSYPHLQSLLTSLWW